MARDCPLHLDGDCLVRRVVDDGQRIDSPAFGSAIEHEVHQLGLVGGFLPQQRLAVAEGDLLALAPPHMQPRFLLEPLHTLVVQ